MRICILSNIGGDPDEGMKNVASMLAKGVAQKHDVMHVNAKKSLLSLNFWQKMVKFKPHIVHIILRPNLSRFIVGNFFKLILKDVKFVISALQPPLETKNTKYLFPFFKADRVLTLDPLTESVFEKMGMATSFLGCGVDTNKFIPISPEGKRTLREKYHIDPGKFVALHVGHISSGRNVEKLIPFHGKDNVQVIIVGSPLFKCDCFVLDSLKSAGCTVLIDFFKNIEEIYQLADCYCFPTEDQSFCIGIPLSVFEASSCNLPVITTKFGALPRMIKEGEGFFYKNSMAENTLIFNQIRDRTINIDTREKIVGYTWGNIVRELCVIYQDVLEKDVN